ncbi:phosphodiesterase [Nocardia cyriacigeorgica]|uniref:Phosphodiesterase n=1 Tax=Nocardia cyriacigeorgica TaxID=135487 RepID=A0A6P1D6E6_9NOCA|nr:phosphodiesterase [Nocardia cyriacigeorgica]NEW45071.1 phosphodiesterase [Nocardia cyriacigeorgica]NEW48986.1 phosphodiesterase [Nocardia cyriacigeorgica]NEW55087.1 phosphodiesterase [Nocardia cyriacigeorgica]
MTKAFEAGARIRHGRVVSSRGLRLSGRFHAEDEYVSLFGDGERAVIARLSKGIGTPAGLPDVLGLAFRTLDRDEHPWDVVLATTGSGGLGRLAITPARGWASARYGSLLPYRFGNSGLTWLFAEPDNDQPATASLDAMAEHLRENTLGFVVTVQGLGTPRRVAGELVLHYAEPREHRTDFFDPMLNHPAEVTLVPEIVTRIRERAYIGSRRGRGEED